MVFLTLVLTALAIIICKVSSRTDPHHTFFVSLLPLLDIEHSAGTTCEFESDDRHQPHAALVA